MAAWERLPDGRHSHRFCGQRAAVCIKTQALWQQLRSNALLRVINDLSDEVFGKAIASVITNINLRENHSGPCWSVNG